ncbi:hypothetical protein Dimus_036203 [Dionaea muscipula]
MVSGWQAATSVLFFAARWRRRVDSVIAVSVVYGLLALQIFHSGSLNKDVVFDLHQPSNLEPAIDPQEQFSLSSPAIASETKLCGVLHFCQIEGRFIYSCTEPGFANKTGEDSTPYLEGKSR